MKWLARARVDLLEGSRIGLFSLRANRLRTLLTTSGIAIGVAALLAIVGIIQGINAAFAAQLASLGSSSLYVSKFPWVISDDNWFELRKRKDLTPQVLEAVRAQSTHATVVVPEVSQTLDVSFRGEQLSDVRVDGTTSEKLDLGIEALASGRFLAPSDDEARRPVAVIGSAVAQGLFGKEDPIGSFIDIKGRPMRVIGVLTARGKMLGQDQDLCVFVPLKTFRAYFGPRLPMHFVVGVTAPSQLNAAQDQLIGILRRARNTPPGAPDDFSIDRPEQLAETYSKITAALYGAAVGIGLITLLVGGIGIMNIMLVSVRERTREIGVRRALGARRRTVMWQFLLEAATVSALGGVLGTTVGLSFAKLLSVVTPLAAAVNPATVVLGVTFSAGVGLLFGIWPAGRAAKLDPAQALRHE